MRMKSRQFHHILNWLLKSPDSRPISAWWLFFLFFSAIVLELLTNGAHWHVLWTRLGLFFGVCGMNALISTLFISDRLPSSLIRRCRNNAHSLVSSYLGASDELTTELEVFSITTRGCNSTNHLNEMGRSDRVIERRIWQNVSLT